MKSVKVHLENTFPVSQLILDLISEDSKIKDFINKKKNKKEDIFVSFDKMFNEDISTISLNKILDEIMIILKPYKLGWLSNN